MADETIPTIANVMIKRVMRGRLKERTDARKKGPPRIIGSQPRLKIISELVAHE